MLPLLFNLKFVLPVLFGLNLLGIFIFRKELPFLKGTVLIFGLLLGLFIGYRFFLAPRQTQKIQASRQAIIKKEGWNYLNLPDTDATYQQKEIQAYEVTLLLFRLVGLQAVMGVLLCTIGIFVAADKKVYAGFAGGFLLLAYLFLT